MSAVWEKINFTNGPPPAAAVITEKSSLSTNHHRCPEFVINKLPSQHKRGGGVFPSQVHAAFKTSKSEFRASHFRIRSRRRNGRDSFGAIAGANAGSRSRKTAVSSAAAEPVDGRRVKSSSAAAAAAVREVRRTPRREKWTTPSWTRSAPRGWLRCGRKTEV